MTSLFADDVYELNVNLIFILSSVLTR